MGKLGTADWSGKCPQCGREIRFIVDKGAALHELPTCRVFDQLDPLEFVTLVRKHLMGPMPWDWGRSWN